MFIKLKMKIYYTLHKKLKKFFVLHSNKIIHISIWAVVTIFLLLFVNYAFNYFDTKINKVITAEDTVGGVDAALRNYKDEVLKYSKQLNLPPEYFMALIMLECSGKNVIKPRYEKGIYYKLKKLQNKKIAKFENLTYETIKNADTEALKNLSRSWGPFQLMGYKCVILDIEVAELRGEKRVYWAMKWISMDYGKYLKAGKYKDAFHIHNAGKPFPENGKPNTYDPDYVKNGIKYMKVFKEKLHH